MELNERRLNAVIEAAYVKASGSQRWLMAISRAAEMLRTRRFDYDQLTGVLTVEGSRGEQYTTKVEHCNCAAQGACKHRAMCRILAICFDEEFVVDPHLHRCGCGIVWSCAEACESTITATCPNCEEHFKAQDFVMDICGDPTCERDVTADGFCIAHPRLLTRSLRAAEAAQWEARQVTRQRENAPLIKRAIRPDVRIDGYSI